MNETLDPWLNNRETSETGTELDMGEIRVKVLLTNSGDEALYRRKKLKKSAVRRYEADAMDDTVSVRSIISAHVMEALGLMSRGNRVAESADGRTEIVSVIAPRLNGAFPGGATSDLAASYPRMALRHDKVTRSYLPGWTRGWRPSDPRWREQDDERM